MPASAGDPDQACQTQSANRPRRRTQTRYTTTGDLTAESALGKKTPLNEACPGSPGSLLRSTTCEREPPSASDSHERQWPLPGPRCIVASGLTSSSAEAARERGQTGGVLADAPASPRSRPSAHAALAGALRPASTDRPAQDRAAPAPGAARPRTRSGRRLQARALSCLPAPPVDPAALGGLLPNLENHDDLEVYMLRAASAEMEIPVQITRPGTRI
jgi:hypothetical protein